MRIPANPFGQEVARAARQPGPAGRPAQYPTEFPNPIGEAVERLGKVGMGAALNRMDDQLFEQRDRERQDQAALIEMDKRREAADKATALTALSNARMAIDELGVEFERGLQDGTIDKSDAAKLYSERLGKLKSDRLASVPEAHRDAVGQDFDVAGHRLGLAIGRAVDKRNEDDTRAGLLSYLETIEREAVNKPGALGAGLAAIEALGPYAGLSAVEREKLGQAVKERVTLNRALAAFNDAKQSPAALNQLEQRLGGDEFKDLDPARVTALRDQIETRRIQLAQKAEIAAARAAREAEAKLRVGAAAADGLSKFLDRGGVPDDAYVATVQAQVAGTPYQALIGPMLKRAASTGGFAAQPLSVMDATLNAMRNQANAGSNPAQQEQIAQLQKIRDAAHQDYKADPLTAARDRGVLPELTPLNVMDLTGLPKQIAERRQQAMRVEAVTGQPVSPLTLAEATALGDQIKQMPAEQRGAAIGVVMRALGPSDQARALAAQVAGKDQTLGTAMMLAASGNRTSAGRTVADIYLKGADVLATKANKGESEKEMRSRQTIQGNMAQAIGSAYFMPAERDMRIDAAIKIQAALWAEGDDDDERAVRLATGGIVTNKGGYQTVKPWGWSDSDFRDWLTATSKALAADAGPFLAGGAQLTGEQVGRALPNSRLAAVGEGQYVIVGAGGQIVRRANGEPLLLDVER